MKLPKEEEQEHYKESIRRLHKNIDEQPVVTETINQLQDLRAQPYITSSSTKKIVSDGKATAYYDFPEGVTTLNDLIEFKNMSYARGNIFKAAYRLGQKDGVDDVYDLNKIIYYAERMLNIIKNKK